MIRAEVIEEQPYLKKKKKTTFKKIAEAQNKDMLFSEARLTFW